MNTPKIIEVYARLHNGMLKPQKGDNPSFWFTIRIVVDGKCIEDTLGKRALMRYGGSEAEKRIKDCVSYKLLHSHYADLEINWKGLDRYCKDAGIILHYYPSEVKKERDL